MLVRVLDVALSSGRDIYAAEALEALAPYLDDALLRRAVDAVAAMEGDVARAVAIEAVAPRLRGPTAAAAVERATDIPDRAMRVLALAAIAPQLDGEAKRRVLDAGLRTAMEVKEVWPRANGLVLLIPQLQGQARRTALQAALEPAVAATKERGDQRGGPLVALLPHLEGADYAAALTALLSMDHLDSRAAAFEQWTPPAEDAHLRITRRVLAEHLLTTRELNRADLLRTLALSTLAPPVLSLAQVEAIALLAIDVCSNWQWQ